LIEKQKQPFPEIIIWSLLKQMVSALHLLHDRKIIHRDISPDNIMILEYDEMTNLLHALLSDFDISREIEGTNFHTANTGKLHYLAPEVKSRDNFAVSFKRRATSIRERSVEEIFDCTPRNQADICEWTS
jgi:serine/threonine protein kinase